MDAVAEFLAQCSQDHIAQHIVSIDLGENKLSFLPKELKGLAYLRRILVDRNPLERKDLELLASFKQLEEVDISWTNIRMLDVYQTIVRFPAIKAIDAGSKTSREEYDELPENVRKAVKQKKVAVTM